MYLSHSFVLLMNWRTGAILYFSDKPAIKHLPGTIKGKLSSFLLFHCQSVKSIHILSFSGPYFSAFGLNMERYSVFLRIQSEHRKIQTRKTPNMDTCHAVILAVLYCFLFYVVGFNIVLFDWKQKIIFDFYSEEIEGC